MTVYINLVSKQQPTCTKPGKPILLDDSAARCAATRFIQVNAASTNMQAMYGCLLLSSNLSEKAATHLHKAW
jgi:hypothetical protein